MFQNEVLRPILKLQNDLFIASSRIIQPNTIKINSQTTEKKLNHRKCDSKDSKYRNTLKEWY
jgi:hypothetical protein